MVWDKEIQGYMRYMSALHATGSAYSETLPKKDDDHWSEIEDTIATLWGMVLTLLVALIGSWAYFLLTWH